MCMALSSVSYAAWAMWWRVIWRPGLATRWYNKLLNGTRARLGKKLLQKQDSANLAPQYGSIALDHSCSPAIPCMVNLSDVHGIPIRCKDLLNASFWTLSIYLVYRRIKFAKENFHLLHDSIWIWLNMIEWYWMWLNMIEYCSHPIIYPHNASQSLGRICKTLTIKSADLFKEDTGDTLYVHIIWLYMLLFIYMFLDSCILIAFDTEEIINST